MSWILSIEQSECLVTGGYEKIIEMTAKKCSLCFVLYFWFFTLHRSYVLECCQQSSSRPGGKSHHFSYVTPFNGQHIHKDENELANAWWRQAIPGQTTTDVLCPWVCRVLPYLSLHTFNNCVKQEKQGLLSHYTEVQLALPRLDTHLKPMVLKLSSPDNKC